MENEKQIIQKSTANKNQLLALLGYIIANEELYTARRNKIHVLDLKKESQTVKESTQKTNKGVDTMKKNCYKRADGRWQYSKQQDGFLYYAIANTYRELLEKIKTIQPRKIKSIKRIKTKTLTVIRYFEYYIESYVKTKKYKSDTIKNWQTYLDKYIKPHFERLSLDRVNTEQLQVFINSIDKERTREVLFQIITRVFRKAYITGKIKKDITLGLEKPKRENKNERGPLTFEEQKKLLDRVKGTKLYAFIMFSLVIGSRREESMRFTLADINEEKLQIHIKGTKTKNADRYVSTTPEFISFLKENLPKGKFDFNICYPTKELKKIFEELNIDNCLHGLRHTCSANLYFLGAKDKYRQLHLGHSSIVITNDIYTNIKENIEKAKLLDLYGKYYPSFD